MKRLWAPWRMEYIKQEKEDGCFLCRILQESEDRQNLVLHRDSHCAVVLNRYPYNNGHLMVAPNRHTHELADLSSEENAQLMELAARAVALLRDRMRADGFNIGFNLGAAAGAGLRDHLHMHVVPRWHGDTNFMPVTADTKVMPQSLFELWDALNGGL